MSDDEHENAPGGAGSDVIQDVLNKNAEALTALSQALQGLRPQAQDAASTRSSKMEKLYGFFIKHGKLRDFKPSEVKGPVTV